LQFEEITAPLVGKFLDHLEKHDGISVRTRNLRLTAVHSFFRFAAFELPEHSAQIQRVLAIPSKRFTRTLVNFLTRVGQAGDHGPNSGGNSLDLRSCAGSGGRVSFPI
jgi:site-specific recombinase XerD